MKIEKLDEEKSEDEGFDDISEQILDELYPNTPTPEEVAKNRQLDPESAKNVDELIRLFGAKISD